MELKGEQQIAAPRDKVWQALNDPEVLRQCIPGCEEIEKTSDTSFDAKVRAKVGPVSARFAGSVTLSDIDPPNGYTISGEGKGGAAGFAKGGAKVTLTDAPVGTALAYVVDATVGGKLAQIGGRLIDSTARKYADTFFSRFREILEGEDEDATPAAMAPLGTDEPSSGSSPIAAVEEVAEETSAPPPSTQQKAAEPARPAAPTETGASVTPGATAEAELAAPVAAGMAADTAAHRPHADRSADPSPPPAEPAADRSVNTWVWVGGLIIVVVLILLVFLG